MSLKQSVTVLEDQMKEIRERRMGVLEADTVSDMLASDAQKGDLCIADGAEVYIIGRGRSRRSGKLEEDECSGLRRSDAKYWRPSPRRENLG